MQKPPKILFHINLILVKIKITLENCHILGFLDHTFWITNNMLDKK